jgi:uncharacterized protein (DUF1499 family)
MNIIKTTLIAIALLSLYGCAVSPLEEQNSDRSLYWCPPLHNCASTEASTFVHNIQPFELLIPLDEAWPHVRNAVTNLEGTEIKHEYEGYIFAKSHSTVFHFLDYFEVLAVPADNRLNVRSSSLIAITDFFVNYMRTEQFREELEGKGVIKKRD